MIKWCLNIIFLLGVSFSFGQQLNISLNKEEVKIGEPFTLTYSVISTFKLDSIVYFEYNDVFPGKNSSDIEKEGINVSYDIEISKGFSDTNYQDGKEFIWKGSYELIAWDSAFVIIPPEIITIEDSIFIFPAGLIHVLSPEINATQPIYDINESFTELPSKSAFLQFIKQNWLWITIASVLLIAVGIYLIRRSQKEPAPLSLREKTLAQIDQLEKSRAYEVNLKEYYFELSVILRRFFADHYQSRIMDKTTAEIEVILAKNGLDKKMILLTRQLLMQSDLVKFAQSVPELKEIQNVTNNARQVVNEIADLDLKDEK
jgi:hypothetical protein